MEGKSCSKSETFNPENINNEIIIMKQSNQHGAFRLIDSGSSEIEEMSSNLTNLARSLSKWILSEYNDFSTESIAYYKEYREQAFKSMKLQEESSFALGLEIYIRGDLACAFRSTTGARGNIGINADNWHFSNLLWPGNEDEPFSWARMISRINFKEVSAIKNFEKKEHPKVMFLLFLQVIIFLAMADDHLSVDKSTSDSREQAYKEQIEIMKQDFSKSMTRQKQEHLEEIESQKVAFNAHLSATTSSLEEKFNQEIKSLTAKLYDRGTKPITSTFMDQSEEIDIRRSGNYASLNHHHCPSLDQGDTNLCVFNKKTVFTAGNARLPKGLGIVPYLYLQQISDVHPACFHRSANPPHAYALSSQLPFQDLSISGLFDFCTVF